MSDLTILLQRVVRSVSGQKLGVDGCGHMVSFDSGLGRAFR